MLRYLRQHGNYLTPGKGITLTSIIVVLLRGIILNLLVWVPILAGLMWLLIWASAYLVPVSLGGLVSSISPPLRPDDAAIAKALFRSELMLAVAAVLLVGCILAFVVYSLATYSVSMGPWSGGSMARNTCGVGFSSAGCACRSGRLASCCCSPPCLSS